MISVISSYRIVSSTSEILPALEDVCQELTEKQFLGMDVIISEVDIRAASQVTQSGRLDELHKARGRLMAVAQGLAAEISRDVNSHRGCALIVPALATNFPNISNLSDAKDRITNEHLWEVAINSLAVCLLLADRLGIKAIEIVCGRRVSIEVDAENQRIRVSSIEDSGSVRRIRQRFVEGIWRAFARAYEELDKQMLPQTAVALELEPDVLALAADVTDLQTLLTDLDEGPDLQGEYEKLKDRKDELRCHFGLNLDWGHFLIALDRADPAYIDKVSKQAYNVIQGPLRERVLHGHVSDHAPGAHWVDAAVGAFRPIEDFQALLMFHSSIIQETPDRRSGDSLGKFSSGAVAIELEASGDAGAAVQSRERLEGLARKCTCPLSTPADLLAECEQRIATLPPELAQSGWFEGVNGAIYHALERLLYRSREPRLGERALLDEGLLSEIRRFLVTRKSDERTALAVRIIETTFQRGGTSVLSSWTNFLLNQEWWGAFYPAYRDHTVHTVYVYLLGWVFYVASPQFRKIVQSENENSLKRPTIEWEFSREWMIAALTHDIGYPFESDKPDVRTATLKKLNDYHEFFISWAILAKGDPRSNTYPILKHQNGSIIRDLTGAAPDSRRYSCPLSKKDAEDLTQFRLPEEAKLFNLIPELQEQLFGLTRGSFELIFDFLRRVPSRGRVGKRPAYLDHGIMSAAMIAALKQAHDQWSQLINAEGDKIRENGAMGVTHHFIDRVRQWANEYQDSVWVKYPLEKVLSSVAAHNIYPEPLEASGGNLHLPEDVDMSPGGCPVLRSFKITKQTPIALLLGMCDSLQEWHRYGFVNPMHAGSFVLEPLDVGASIDPNSGQVVLSYPGHAELLDQKVREFDGRFGTGWKDFLRFGE